MQLATAVRWCHWCTGMTIKGYLHKTSSAALSSGSAISVEADIVSKPVSSNIPSYVELVELVIRATARYSLDWSAENKQKVIQSRLNEHFLAGHLTNLHGEASRCEGNHIWLAWWPQLLQIIQMWKDCVSMIMRRCPRLKRRSRAISPLVWCLPWRLQSCPLNYARCHLGRWARPMWRLVTSSGGCPSPWSRSFRRSAW